jgi:transcriptional regulator with XRE-family HTH domain
MKGETSYNVAVSPDELWRAVGRILQDRREGRDWTVNQTAELAGVDAKTVNSIEAGDVGQVNKVNALAGAFGLTIVDVISSALDRTKEPLSPEAKQLLRHFGRISVPARRAVLSVAEEYPDAPLEESPAPRPPPADQSPKGPHKK